MHPKCVLTTGEHDRPGVDSFVQGEVSRLQLITKQKGVVMLMSDRMSRWPNSQSSEQCCVIPADSLFKDKKELSWSTQSAAAVCEECLKTSILQCAERNMPHVHLL